MKLSTILPQLFEIVIFPLLSVGTVYLISLIKTKIQQLKQEKDDVLYSKYLTMLEETITNCVLATNQTYVAELKKAGKFDKEAQKKAFENTYNAVMAILDEDAKDFLQNAIGDL